MLQEGTVQYTDMYSSVQCRGKAPRMFSICAAMSDDSFPGKVLYRRRCQKQGNGKQAATVELRECIGGVGS